MLSKKYSQKRHRTSRWRRCRQIVPVVLLLLTGLSVFHGYFSLGNTVRLLGSAQAPAATPRTGGPDMLTATVKPATVTQQADDVTLDRITTFSQLQSGGAANAVPDARIGGNALPVLETAKARAAAGTLRDTWQSLVGAGGGVQARGALPGGHAAAARQATTRSYANLFMRGSPTPIPAVTAYIPSAGGAAKHLIRHQVLLPFPEGGYATDPASLLPFEGAVWLTVGMPTFPRKGDPDYLHRSVHSFLAGLPLDDTDLFYGKIQLVIMNNKPGDHRTFYEVRDEMRMLPAPDKQRAAAHIVFVENPGTVIDPDPTLEEPNDSNNPEALPGSHVRNQTAQVLELTKLLKDKSKLFMFVEDDFIFCTNWLEATQMALKKASVINPQWGALRISFGMSGLILRNADLPHFMHWAWRNITKLPIDVIWVEYLKLHFLPAGRELFVYHKVLLEHIGVVSSFAMREKRNKWPGCYESMDRVWSLTKFERFDRMKCPDSDISPCHRNPGRGPAVPLPDWATTNINWHP